MIRLRYYKTVTRLRILHHILLSSRDNCDKRCRLSLTTFEVFLEFYFLFLTNNNIILSMVNLYMHVCSSRCVGISGQKDVIKRYHFLIVSIFKYNNRHIPGFPTLLLIFLSSVGSQVFLSYILCPS